MRNFIGFVVLIMVSSGCIFHNNIVNNLDDCDFNYYRFLKIWANGRSTDCTNIDKLFYVDLLLDCNYFLVGRNRKYIVDNFGTPSKVMNHSLGKENLIYYYNNINCDEKFKENFYLQFLLHNDSLQFIFQDQVSTN
jgi:hypothetical protein